MKPALLYNIKVEVSEHAFGRVYAFKDDPKTAYIEGISVTRAFRRKGLGNEVVVSLENIAVAMGSRRIKLCVLRDSWVYNWFLRLWYRDSGPYEPNNQFIWMEHRI